MHLSDTTFNCDCHVDKDRDNQLYLAKYCMLRIRNLFLIQKGVSPLRRHLTPMVLTIRGSLWVSPMWREYVPSDPSRSEVMTEYVTR